jgi:hypothetical protein
MIWCPDTQLHTYLHMYSDRKLPCWHFVSLTWSLLPGCKHRFKKTGHRTTENHNIFTRPFTDTLRFSCFRNNLKLKKPTELIIELVWKRFKGYRPADVTAHLKVTPNVWQQCDGFGGDGDGFLFRNFLPKTFGRSFQWSSPKQSRTDSDASVSRYVVSL